jgi:4-hydroxybutyrate dehydrogenase
MVPFRLVPRIALYERFTEFIDAFKVNNEDLIITNEFVQAGLKTAKMPARMIFQEKFGIGEPSNLMMDGVFQEARKQPYKRVIAIGGGTVIDVAKLLVLGGEGNTVDYFEGHLPTEKAHELIVIPTTCGTGSEVTNIAIMELKEQKTKKGLATNAIYADCAVLIPELLMSLPYKVFATSSIDALIHATESFVAPESNPLTELFGTKAIAMIVKGYQAIADKGPEVRKKIIGDFLLASTYAGIAFGNTGCGAVHAMSYPLGGIYHVPHGEANQQMFTTIFKKYKELQPQGKIEALEELLADILSVPVQQVWSKFDALLETILPRKPLKEYGMKETEIESFADSVIKNQQRLLKNNYVHLSREQMVTIYRELY